MGFTVEGPITEVQTIAEGRGIRDLAKLRSAQSHCRLDRDIRPFFLPEGED